MGKTKKTVEKLAILGVALWFLGELAKKRGDIQAYRCWHCNGMIKPNETYCPWCGARNKWGGLRV